MKHYRLSHKYICSADYVQDYFGYTKKEAQDKYLEKYPHFKRNEIQTN